MNLAETRAAIGANEAIYRARVQMGNSLARTARIHISDMQRTQT